jgi:hypothetical protein
LINGRSAWASSTSTVSWAARRINGRRTCTQNTTPVFPWIGKLGYNLTTDLADEAVKYMSSLNAAAPETPFFVYYVPGRHALAAPADEGVDREIQGASSTWAGKSCATRSSRTRSDSA